MFAVRIRHPQSLCLPWMILTATSPPCPCFRCVSVPLLLQSRNYYNVFPLTFNPFPQFIHHFVIPHCTICDRPFHLALGLDRSSSHLTQLHLGPRASAVFLISEISSFCVSSICFVGLAYLPQLLTFVN
jgi:hypothetical protein